MMRIKRSVLWLSLLCLAIIIILIHDINELSQIGKYNQAIQENKLEEIISFNSSPGRLANAYLLQQRGEFQESLEAYAILVQEDDKSIRQLVKYNLANLYMQRAIKLSRTDNDLAIPLIELAKVSYREVLEIDSGQWFAKYNLERALNLLPDVEKVKPEEDILPERSPQAIGKVLTRDQLP